MKRRLALILAAIMTLTALPMTVFADSDNTMTASPYGANKTMLFENSINVEEAGDVKGLDNVNRYVRGGDLKIKLKDDMKAGTMFKIELTGGEFYFRNIEGERSYSRDLHTDSVAIITEKVKQARGLKGIDEADFKVDNNKLVVNSKDFEGTGSSANLWNEDNLAANDPALPKASFDTAKGAYFGKQKTYVRFGNVLKDTTAQTREAREAYVDAPYVLFIENLNEDLATIMVLDELKKDDTIVIPMVTRLKDADDYRVKVVDTGSVIFPSSTVFAQKTSGKTKTSAKKTVIARTRFELAEIIIKEERINSIKNSKGFELVAPRGYYFNITDNTKVYTELGLTWDKSGIAGEGKKDVDYKISHGKDEDIVRVTDLFVKASTSTRGSLYITGLELVSEDYDKVTEGEISLEIRNYDGNKDYNEESFVVAKSQDYDVALKLDKPNDDVPVLFSGRYEADITNDYVEKDLVDKEHKAATVVFEELVPDAWWAARTTKFTLPEEVSFLKVKVTPTNIDNTFEKGYYNTNGKSGDYVRIKNNELVFNDLRIKDKTKVAKLKLETWLSIAPDFDGEIKMTLTGSGIRDYYDKEDEALSLVIAEAIRPVNIETEVTEVQIGYQYYSVADFTIVENKAGALLDGEDVYISITDNISTDDVKIASGYDPKLEAGDIKISNIKTGGILGKVDQAEFDAQLSFRVDRASNKEAAKIKFSNVQVKIDRNVPYSNLSSSDQRGINLVVWGPAVAKNYYNLVGDKSKVNRHDYWTTPGVSAKYINVVTSATDDTTFKNVVEVTIGNPVFKVNGKEETMEVAAYISTASNSTMVPLRFVATALGLNDSKVGWDGPTSTATVDAGTRIVQFQKGSNHYLVNGVSIPMVSPDGLPVAAEITNERIFIPFRALGDAFNIPVDWSEATATATYNKAIVR